MLRHVVLGAVGVMALAATASAADMYAGPGGLKDEYVPVNTWAGFYVGVNGGYGWGTGDDVSAKEMHWDHPYVAPPYQVTYSKSGDLDPSGGFGGGQIGYNWQRDRLVYGLEADIQGADINGSETLKAGNAWHWNSTTASSDLNWFGTVRGRIGLTVIDPLLLYVTGGLAYGNADHDLTVINHSWTGATNTSKVSNSNTEVGYVLGAGAEYQIMPKWTLKVEYQYMDLGSDVLTASNWLYHHKATGTGDFSDAYQTVRVGLNYHFAPAYEPLK
ncbi:MAG: outer membrane protein [Rhodomicrobium sp.]